jgi:hypothetical protein
MKTTKAYGVWCPDLKSVDPSSIFRQKHYTESNAQMTHMRDTWEEAKEAGYRVIPVTISYELPTTAKKKERLGLSPPIGWTFPLRRRIEKK